MTPRALVTAIATTAFGFALIISSVAGSRSAGEQASEAFDTMTRHTIYTQPYALTVDEDASPHCEAWNAPCEIAL